MNRSLTIDADGTSAACLVATRTYAPAPPSALRPAVNALRRLAAHNSVDDLGRTDLAALELLRRDTKRYSSYGQCATCRWKSECRICPLSAVAERDWPDARKVPDFLCGFTRLLLKHRERFPPQLQD